MTNGMIILGARGSLGTSVSRSLPIQDYFLQLDKEDDNESGIISCDLEKPDDIESVISTVPFKSVDYWRLCVASGVYDGSSATPLMWEDIHRSLNINLIGAAHFVVRFSEKVFENGRKGRIVIVSSTAARVGSRDIGYGIAKTGLEGLVRSLSKTCAREGLTIIGVSPGIFESSMSKGQSPERRQQAIQSTHTGRITGLSEVRDVVLYALFQAPDAMTGTFLNPNGGQIG